MVAMPSASTSVVKIGMSALLDDGAVAAGPGPPRAVEAQDQVVFAVVDAVALGPGADDEIGGVRRAAVLQPVGVVRARLPGGGLAGGERGLAGILDEGERAGEQVDELVLGLVPV